MKTFTCAALKRDLIEEGAVSTYTQVRTGSIEEGIYVSLGAIQLAQHPWWSLLIVVVAVLVTQVLSWVLVVGVFRRPPDAPITRFSASMMAHITLLFVIVPFVLGLPLGVQTFSEYLDAIRLTQIQPFVWLVLLGLSCYLILAFSQVCGVLVYRALEGKPITGKFLHRAFDLSVDLPPRSWSLLESIPSSFEEIAFRGVILTLFLAEYAVLPSVAVAAISFGVVHLLNLLTGREPVWVVGQVAWASILGLFYGVVVIESGSLWPAMLVHYLSNVFVGSLTSYLQASASTNVQAVYGIVFSFGIVPTTLMCIWVFVFTTIWPIVP
jgi:membrane protease YdiL (CAAX protease family)